MLVRARPRALVHAWKALRAYHVRSASNPEPTAAHRASRRDALWRTVFGLFRLALLYDEERLRDVSWQELKIGREERGERKVLVRHKRFEGVG